MFTHIKKFLEEEKPRKKDKINWDNWQKPIILAWLNNSAMKKSLLIIDKKVSYLLNKNAKRKIEQWFLADDQNFNSITAERYIIDYLRLKNKDVKDNLFKEGVDAIYNFNGQEIGIEVTTLNSFIASWIFTERLPMYLEEKKLFEKESFNGHTLEIKYDYERIKEEMNENNIYVYIQNVGENIFNAEKNTLNVEENILSENIKELKPLKIKYSKTSRKTGCIVWDYDNDNADDFLIIKYLTDGLINSLSEEKKKNQLSKYKKNLIFVGINHVGPINWINPGIFNEIGNGRPVSYKEQIDYIQDFLSKELKKNVIGVCYYVVDLEREEPFYPLRIFWRDANDKISLNI